RSQDTIKLEIGNRVRPVERNSPIVPNFSIPRDGTAARIPLAACRKYHRRGGLGQFPIVGSADHGPRGPDFVGWALPANHATTLSQSSGERCSRYTNSVGQIHCGSTMSFEVEVKYRTNDHAGLEARLLALGAAGDPAVTQEDDYLGHPARDFAVTNEA